jgi:hypothetical protein
LSSEHGALRWTRTGLPAAGGYGDQDGWLMQALEFARGVYQQLANEHTKRWEQEADVKRWREQRGRE